MSLTFITEVVLLTELWRLARLQQYNNISNAAWRNFEEESLNQKKNSETSQKIYKINFEDL